MLERLPREKTVLLDGGMGRELEFRGVDVPTTIWSAGALMTNPDAVEEIHLDYIKAGADIITTNTYGVIRRDLEKIGIEERFSELNILACKLAKNARGRSGKNIAIAGSLPPLRGSFRPDLVGKSEQIEAEYVEQAELLAPYVDLLLCETMSSGVEGRAAVRAASATGKPVWVSWTLHEDQSGRLRSGECIEEAIQLLEGMPVAGHLAGCSAPESITALMPQLVETGAPWVGGYANTFTPIPQDWELNGESESDGLLSLRQDLDPIHYAAHVREWLNAGATVVGGCCGTRPAHIAELRALIDLIASV